MFSINNVELHYTTQNTKLTPAKMNIDGGLGTSLIYLPFYIYILTNGVGLDGVTPL